MEKKIITKIIIFIIIFLITLFISNKLYAVETYFKVNSNIPGESEGFLLKNTNSELTKINIDQKNKKLKITNIDTSYNVKNSKQIDFELTLLGGVFSGTEYNFIVFGDSNTEESDSKEVLRVVKYSKTWQRLQVCSYKGINTEMPFYSGTCDITELNGNLLINTCHRMYTDTKDGKKHQSNMFFQIDIDTMENLRSITELSNFSTGYVSHSFDQYIINDGTCAYTVDHGDSNPRGVAVSKFDLRSDGKYRKRDGDCVYTAPECPGYTTYTGYDISSVELSSNNILITGTSVNMDLGLVSTNTKQNLYLLVVPKDNIIEESTKIKWFTSYPENDKTEIANIHLTKVNDNRFVLMWREISKTEFGNIKMVILDGAGETLTDTITIGGNLSDNIKPISFNNKIVWTFSTNTIDTVVFYLDINTDEKFKAYKNLNILNTNCIPHFTTEFYAPNNEFIISKYDDYSENVTVPYPNFPFVTTVFDSNVFSSCTKVKNVIISEGFKNLEGSAFSSCKSLESVTIPSTCTEIEDNCFYHCENLKQINFKGNNIKRIGNSAFSKVAIIDLRLPDSIESIGEWCFYHSKIKKLELPKNLKNVEKYAFSGCADVEKIVLPDKLESIKEHAFDGFRKITDELVIPASVKEIGASAFYCSENYSKIKFQNSNVSVNRNAFELRPKMLVGESKKFFEGLNFSKVEVDEPTYVQVSNDGTIKALKAGYTPIRYYKDEKVDECATIYLQIEEQTPINETKIEITNRNFNLYINQTLNVEAKVSPSTAVQTTKITYISSNINIASVDSKGLVKGKKAGKVTITAITNDGKSDSTTVTVLGDNVPVNNLHIDKETLTLTKFYKSKITATVYPYYATDKIVKWSSADTCIATVDSNGNVTALKEGKTKIKAVAGNYYKICEVTVISNATSQESSTKPSQITPPQSDKQPVQNTQQQPAQNVQNNLLFKDVKRDDWFYNAVKYTYENKMISGYNSTTFAPNDKLTRGMIVTILYRMENSPNNNGKSKFSDVPSTEWYSKAIKWAVDNHIVH
ncbi:MAG: leucine-rich repeat protein, partial [Clostridia bacterium]|nr:leucine-rich repeat protein [Clostridia bacterium]